MAESNQARSGDTNAMPDKPRRRWFRFSLRTMFVALMVATLSIGWVGIELKWLRERHRAIMHDPRVGNPDANWPAPLLVRILGEGGVHYIYREPGSDPASEENKRLSRLFPEAEWVPTWDLVATNQDKWERALEQDWERVQSEAAGEQSQRP